MNILEAMNALNEGKKIRLVNGLWGKDEYIYLEGETIKSHGGAREEVFVTTFNLQHEVWEEYKEPILDDEEKKYLSAVIKPFRKKVAHIAKMDSVLRGKQYISVYIEYGNVPMNMHFPYFDANTMYKGMKADKRYTLKELGL